MFDKSLIDGSINALKTFWLQLFQPQLDDLKFNSFWDFRNKEASGIKDFVFNIEEVIEAIKEAAEGFWDLLSCASNLFKLDNDNKFDIFHLREGTIMEVGVTDHLVAPVAIFKAWKIY